LVDIVGNETTDGIDHPPPRMAIVGGQESANCSGMAWVAGLGCDLAVGDDIARLQGAEDSSHRALEGCSFGVHETILSCDSCKRCCILTIISKNDGQLPGRAREFYT